MCNRFIIGKESASRIACSLLALLGLLWIIASPSTEALAQGAPFVVVASVQDSTQGTIAPSGAVQVSAGGSQTFVVTPNPGYQVAVLQVDGRTVGKMATYTFTDVSANHTIAAGFSRITYTIDATSGPNGQVSPNSLVYVECGENQTFTITPNDGYRIGDVVVDGVSKGAVTSYTFNNVWKDHTISVTFVALQPEPTSTTLPPAGPGVTDLAGLVAGDGVFLGDVHAVSGDNKVGITVAQGTTGRTASGGPLTQIAIVKTANLPGPAGFVMLGSAYEIAPETAVLDRPVNLTINYDVALLPAGVAEGELGIATYDRRTGNWTTLGGTAVNASSHSIAGILDRFVPCAVVAPLRQATLGVSDLRISPNELSLGDKATVSVTVANNGGESGTFAVVLKVNGAVESTKEVTLAAGANERVDFSLTGKAAGLSVVSIEGLSATLTVAAAPSTSGDVTGWLPLAGIVVGVIGTAALLGAFLLWRRGRKRVPPTRPAVLAITELEVSPREVRVGESATVTVTVTNSGDHAGTYKVTVRMEGLLRDTTRDVTVLAGAKERVGFRVAATAAGVFPVKVDDLSETLTVVEALQSTARPDRTGPRAGAAKGT